MPTAIRSRIPSSTLAPGERLRITVINNAPGMVHDLAIDAVSAATPPLTAGQAASIEFTAPEKTGNYTYRCRPHALMMKGVAEGSCSGLDLDPTLRSLVSLREAISTPAGKSPYVRRLFHTIADRYDLITVLLSYGQDQRWKRRLIDLAGPLEGRIVLDLACGTGDLAFLASRRWRTCHRPRHHLSHDRIGQSSRPPPTIARPAQCISCLAT